MGPKLVIDESLFPKVIVTWPDGPLTDEEFRRGVDALSAISRRGRPYVQLHDARAAARPSATQRQLAARRQKEDAEVARRVLRGIALVLSNPLLAGAVTAINWVFPPPFPQRTFSKMEDADDWLSRKLAEE